MCHEQKRKRLMLDRRWESASLPELRHGAPRQGAGSIQALTGAGVDWRSWRVAESLLVNTLEQVISEVEWYEMIAGLGFYPLRFRKTQVVMQR
jgi:hypothetical protein